MNSVVMSATFGAAGIRAKPGRKEYMGNPANVVGLLHVFDGANDVTNQCTFTFRLDDPQSASVRITGNSFVIDHVWGNVGRVDFETTYRGQSLSDGVYWALVRDGV